MRALVTGGGGFVGGALVRLLVREGHDVRSSGRSVHAAVEAAGAESVRADLRDPDALARAVDGRDTVFHVAALTGVWGPEAEFRATNVEGTRNVIDACRRAGVRRLVYTSSPSVCFDGADHVRAGPDLPYARRFLCAYPRTKAAAERLVLAANDSGGLATCAIRPHLVFGPGDPHLVPRLLERGRSGRLAVVGNGRNEVGLTHVENAAACHLDAALALEPGAPCAGRAYFLNQEEPVRLWEWIAALFRSLGIPPPRRRVPARLAYAAGAALESLWRAGRLAGEPPMTRFVAAQLASSHSYDVGPARRDLGYRERVGLAEGTERLVRSLAADPGGPAPASASVEGAGEAP